ncbi:MAG: PQQ-dependent sugar dehydrogenase [Gluconacetobacter diazotrophicus]|nr:PQQ-dependent sugar dehydrogenase [Gluconacetobacter diazotrophicus]
MKTPPRLFLAALLTTLAGTPAVHAQTSATIAKGNIIVDLEKFATIPDSDGQPPRINVLRPAPDGRLFVNDQRGYLYTVSADGATVTQYLDLSKYVSVLQDNGERGFQSFAFHPDFDNPGTAGYGKFYTVASQPNGSTPATFTPNVSGATHDHDEVLLEWTAADPSAATFTPASASAPYREVLRIARPNSNHNGGYISFNPTATAADRGNLYYGMGDSGGGGDPYHLAQTLGDAYGAILRINPLKPTAGSAQASANGQYSIPADNPHYTTNSAFLPEKFAAGFRNPQRFTWDSANGRMFVADIGQNTVEEIDVVQAGANYGWNAREGDYVYNASTGGIGADDRGDSATTGFTYPIAEYFHYSSIGNAVTTGPVYRNARIPALNGRLIFSDFVNGVPYTLDAVNLPNGGTSGITELRLRSNGTEMSFLSMIQAVNSSATRADLRYGFDAAQNVYFLDKQDGVIRRIAPAGQLEFFAGQKALGNGVDYLAFANGQVFGYYAFLSDPNYLYHFDLGYEYVFDAADGNSGVYLYDFASNTFFYTSPSFPFPYLYDFTLNTVLYYFPNTNAAGHYTSNPRYFYDFATSQVITK